MAGGRNKLSAVKVAKASRTGYLLDGGGLYLQIAERALKNVKVNSRSLADAVTKSWCFRYRDRATGKLRELGLGPFPDVTLEKAREKAADLRDMLRDGKDPKSERDAVKAARKVEVAKAMTFAEAVAACIADKRAGWKNEKHADQWANTLQTYASPIIGALPVAAIDLPMIRKVLDPIWTTKNETASRVRQRMETVLSWATVSGYRTGENPARWRGHLDHILTKPSKVQKVEHHAALAYAEMAGFLTQLRTHQGTGALALEFAILTAARTGEVIVARWEEFDLEKKLWVVPAEHMKASKEHIVPLSGPALKIIKDLEQIKTSAFVFPGAKAEAPLSNMAMSATLKRMARMDITVHGFRSTFRDWAGEQTNFPRELIEHSLAHQLKNKAEAAYARSTMPEKRRELMEVWADYCEGKNLDRAAKAAAPDESIR